jgi:ribose 5-phosphate isomerase B
MSDSPRVAFAADDSDGSVDAVVAYLEEHASLIRPTDSDSWPDMANAVAGSVVSGAADFGILMCWTGTGTAIAANKVPGIRAAQASDAWIAENARRWNDANVLTLSLKRTAPDVAVECVAAFLSVSEPDPEELSNIEKLAGK